jgi:hypothetical protein
MFQFQSAVRQKWATIDLGERGAFEVLVRQPSWADKLQDHGLQIAGVVEGYADHVGASTEHRIRSSIVGWRGLQDAAGTPLPFSWDALTALCEQVPAVFEKLWPLASEAFSGLREDSVKNSEPLPSDSSGAATETSATLSAT